MLYFDPNPNYARTGKYIQWPGTSEQMQAANPEGYLIAIDWWQTREDVLRIENGVKLICGRYEVTEYFDDVLLLILIKYKEVNEAISYLEANYKHSIRAKELANILLIFMQAQQGKSAKLTLTNLLESAKSIDVELISWIGQSIFEAIENGNYPLSLLGMTEINFVDEESGKISLAKVKAAQAEQVISPNKIIKDHKADLCLFLHKYMITETDIKPDPDMWFSDKLLNFYFDVLELLGYTNRFSFGSDAKDYTRSLLWQRLKQLNPSLSGK